MGSTDSSDGDRDLYIVRNGARAACIASTIIWNSAADGGFKVASEIAAATGLMSPAATSCPRSAARSGRAPPPLKGSTTSSLPSSWLAMRSQARTTGPPIRRANHLWMRGADRKASSSALDVTWCSLRWRSTVDHWDASRSSKAPAGLRRCSLGPGRPPSSLVSLRELL